MTNLGLHSSLPLRSLPASDDLNVLKTNCHSCAFGLCHDANSLADNQINRMDIMVEGFFFWGLPGFSLLNTALFSPHASWLNWEGRELL